MSASKKPKLVRDSFTIPKAEFAAIDTLKDRAIALGTSVKKSELLRAGLMALQGLNDAAFKAVLAAVPTLKTGRPAAPKAKASKAAAPTAAAGGTPAVAAKKPAPAAPKATPKAAAASTPKASAKPATPRAKRAASPAA